MMEVHNTTEHNWIISGTVGIGAAIFVVMVKYLIFYILWTFVLFVCRIS